MPDKDDIIPLKPPHNQNSILELDSDPSPSESGDDSSKKEVIEVIEESEEDDKAELGEYLLNMTNIY